MRLLSGFVGTSGGFAGLVFVGERSNNSKFSTYHQDQSMESSSNEGGVDLHTLVDRARKRSRERG